MRDSHYSPFLLLETPGFWKLLWAPTPGPPLRFCSGDLTAPPDPPAGKGNDLCMSAQQTFGGGGLKGWGHMKFSQTERGDQQLFCCFQGGIKNLTESFIPFLPHPPREVKNDKSLIHNAFRKKDGSVRYTHIKVTRAKGYFTHDINGGGDNMYTADNICKMIEFLIDNIFVQFGGRLFRQVIGIPMGTNCAPLLADLFLHSYENEFFDNMIRSGHRRFARSFNLCYRYIDDLIVFNNKKFLDYLKEIYPSQLTVEKANKSDHLADYLDLTFIIDSGGKLSTRLYDKRDDFDFHIVNFPYLSSNIPSGPSYAVYISQLIRYARCCSHYDDFRYRHKCLVDRLLSQGYTHICRIKECGGAGCPPPPIIFERLKLPQQIIYRRKENLSESPNHQKYWENILVSRFYEQFSRNRRNLGHFRKFEKISNS